MEEKIIGKDNYFDYVIIIFSIGFTYNLDKVFQNIYDYLKIDGKVIISWTHPLYAKTKMIEDSLVFNKSYFDEDNYDYNKSGCMVSIVDFKISTIINKLITNNFTFLKLIESDFKMNNVKLSNSNFFNHEKIAKVPSTVIYVAKKSE